MKTNDIVSTLVLLFLCLGCDGETAGASDGSHVSHQPNLCEDTEETDCTGGIESDDAGYIKYHFVNLQFSEGPVRVVSCTCDNGCPSLYTAPFKQREVDAFCRDTEVPADAGTGDAGPPCQEPDAGRFAVFFCRDQPDAE